MKKINQKVYEKLIYSLVENNKLPSLTSDVINEFKIGKSYFYEIKSETILNIHDWLNKHFLGNIEINHAATAFRKNSSYLNFFEPHRLNYNFLRLDITSFFHSINIKDIQSIFMPYFQFEEESKLIYNQTLLDSFITLVTYKVPKSSSNEKFRDKVILPMGFKTSPIISNIIFRQIDIQLQKICSQKNITYSRYADDMLFSARKDEEFVLSDYFINEVTLILNQLKFKINKHKTIKSKHTLSLNGYTIQYSSYTKNELVLKEKVINEFRISNKKIEIIQKLIHMKEKENKESSIILKKLFEYELKFFTNDPEIFKKYNDDQLRNKVSGYRSYIISFIKFNNVYNCMEENTIIKYSKLIKELNKTIDKL